MTSVASESKLSVFRRLATPGGVIAICMTVAVVGALGYVIGNHPAPASAVSAAATPSVGPTEDQMAAAVTAYSARPPHDGPDLGLCVGAKLGDGACRATRYSFVTDNWPGAWKGDIERARNVAFCLSSGCDGAVMPSSVQGCAWNLLIAGSGSGLVEDVDADNLGLACGKLDRRSRQVAAIRAGELRHLIPALYEPED